MCSDPFIALFSMGTWLSSKVPAAEAENGAIKAHATIEIRTDRVIFIMALGKWRQNCLPLFENYRCLLFG
jgi:hypothetical protein